MHFSPMHLPSPSSRRAWIEIDLYKEQADLTQQVALLAEGVDRNTLIGADGNTYYPSPSSRRAWIEIRDGRYLARSRRVALLAEGVDRNTTSTACGKRAFIVALLAEGVDRNCTP